jgi:CheY-like chemotaxis protein
MPQVQYGGSGLGLFISRELTELQGGEIGIKSSEDVGSMFIQHAKGAGDLRETGTFAFYIKARKATPSEEPNGLYVPTSRSSGLISPGRIATAREKHNYHILLVEDNLINQKVLSKQLRSAGCTVHVAVCLLPSSYLRSLPSLPASINHRLMSSKLTPPQNHGGEALDFLSKTTLWKDCHSHGTTSGPRMDLSLILMDLEMPIMDGLACTRRIRDLERDGKVEGHVPIIAVTANTRMEQMDRAIEAGMVSDQSLLDVKCGLIGW